MTENVFTQFLPNDVSQNGKLSYSNPVGKNDFDQFLPDDVKNKPLKNEFKVSDTPDDKLLYKNLSIEEQFNQFLPDDQKVKQPTKLFYEEPDEEFGVGDALLLGMLDTVRGVTQFVGGEKVFLMEDDLKTQQAKLNKAMAGPNGGLITAAYMGGAILDPLTWLIPVLRGRNLYSMALSGGVAGGLAGALGYVDNTTFFDQRYKQALGGALGGSIITPIIGKTAQKLKVKQLERAFGLDKKPIDLSKIPDDQKVKVILPGGEDIKIMEVGGKKAKQIIKGRKGYLFEEVRKRIPKFKLNESTITRDPRTGEFKVIDKNKNNNKNFILRGPREFFKNILGAYVKPVTDPIAKGTQVITKPIVEGKRKAQTLYSEKIGRPAFDYFTAEKGVGPELGTGLAGAAFGFSLPEEDGNMITRMNRAVLGFVAGFGGMHIARKDATKFSFRGTEYKNIGHFLGKNFVDMYNIPPIVKKLKAEDLGGLRGKIELEALRIAQEANELSIGERRVLYNILEGDIAYGVAPKDLDKIAKKARANITRISQMFIDSGLLTEETVVRNLQRYLRRTYGGKELSKLGSDLKARGILEEITPLEWIERYSKTKAFKVDDAGKTVPLEGHNGWELFGRVRSPKTNEPTKDSATQEVVEKLAADPKTANKPMITARWEYTKQERLGMGEIEDGAFAILETGRMMGATLPQYKFYQDLAEQPFTKTDPTAKEIERFDLVKIPTGVRQDTLVEKYGALSGKFVPREIYDNIISTYKSLNEKSGFAEGYRKLNQLWKASKTAWNPTVHFNNIVSNLVLLDLVDGSYRHLPLAAKAFRDASNGKSVKVLEEAQNLGVINSDYVTKELGDIDMKKLNLNFYKVSPDKDVLENGVNIAKGAFDDIVLKNKFGAQKLSEWYQREDHIFRLALYMDRIEKGFKPRDAAADARKSFVDYDIDAPAINLLRNFPTPFLAYTYRIIPILAETAVVRPWKFVKYAVLGYMANNLGELLGEGSPEAERAAMPEQRKGRILGLPVLPHRNIKVPNAFIPGTPEGSFYIDVTRYVPGGDILDLNGSGAFPFLPAPLQANFGVAGDVLLPLMGYDLFRQDKIKGQGISDFEDLKVRGKAVLDRTIPNFPFIPGSYASKKIEKARVSKDPLRQDRSELLAFLNSIGFKLQQVDLTRLKVIKGFEFSRKVNGIREQMSIEAKKFRNNEISGKEYNQKIQNLNNLYNDIRNRYVKDLNVPAENQEYVPFTKIFPVITDALTKQTESLFNKNKKQKTFKQFLPKN